MIHYPGSPSTAWKAVWPVLSEFTHFSPELWVLLAGAGAGLLLGILPPTARTPGDRWGPPMLRLFLQKRDEGIERRHVAGKAESCPLHLGMSVEPSGQWGRVTDSPCL